MTMHIDWTKPLIPALREVDIEVDQRIRTALSMVGITENARICDDHLFLALYYLNALPARHLAITQEHVPSLFQVSRQSNTDPESVRVFPTTLGEETFELAAEHARTSGTFGTRSFLKGLIPELLRLGDDYPRRSFTLDVLSETFSGDSRTKLSKQPSLCRLLRDLEQSVDDAEDYQYFLTIDDRGRLAFRVASVLNDFVQSPRSDVLLPQRAILTHFRDQFGNFTADEIDELEELINNPKAKESDFQRFFDAHTHFLRIRDYREVHSQLTLIRPKPEGPLIPDFLLTDRSLQRAAVAELKLPKARLITDQPNRRRFSSAILEARTQLLRYRDWFRIPENRRGLVSTIGMEVYEPQLIVIIGRSSEFEDQFDRQQLRADNPDLEIVTYDDIVNEAKKRRIIIYGQ